jgi:ATP-dependent helicase/nuclease subunit B
MSDIRLITGAPESIEHAFVDQIRLLRGGEPLAPVDVLVGGVLMRPYLQRLIAEQTPGLINVRFSTLGELGVRLGERTLAASEKRPLPAIAARAYAAEVTRGCTTYFAPVAETPGFAEAARRLIRELRQESITPETLAASAVERAESPAKGEALADLYQRYVDGRLAYYDGDDALVEADPERFEGTGLLVYGIWRLSAVARSLLERLATRTAVTIYLPSVDPDADGVHAEFRDWLESRGAALVALPQPGVSSFIGSFQRNLFTGARPVEPDESVMLTSAPDPLAETREAARACLAWASEGIAFREMAITYRQAEVYRPLVEGVFAEAGIPVYLDDGPSLAERPLGRRILALLDLIDSPLRRRDVMAFLSDGWMPKATRERFDRAPIARWDSASRRAGIAEGIDQWLARLGRLRESELAAASEEGAPDWLQRRVADCDSLIAFITELAANLAAHPARASWSESLVYLSGLLSEYVEGSDKIMGFLASLAKLDALVPEVSFERFLAIAQAEIQALKAGDLDEGNQGAFGRRGVNILDVNQVRQLRFRAVVVLGLTERSFPPPPRQDPLLLDGERQRLNDAIGSTLPLRALGPDPEPLQFALAVHAARDRLFLSTRRATQAGGRAQLPSSFFRLAASALAGRRITVEDVDRLAEPWFRRVPAGRVGADTLDRALTAVERERTLLERDPAVGRALLERDEPRAVRAQELRRARWAARQLTAYDGVFVHAQAIEAAERRFAAGRPLVPTGLEAYAECPYRYFLSSMLRVSPLEEPEAILRIDPMTRGKVIHRALQRFIAELVEELLDPANAARYREAILRIAGEELGLAEEAGLTGSSLLWGGDRQDILDDLLGWLDRELAEPGPHTQRALEVTFGLTPWPGEEVSPLASDRPVEITAGDRVLRIAGRIDRIDYDPKTGFRIIDYKTGKGPKARDGSLDRGKALQLSLYLLAGAQLLGLEPESGEAAYHVASRRGGFKRITFTGDDLAERRADLERVLERISEGIATGDFHPEPTQNTCRGCDYNGLCDVGRYRIAERKATDPRVTSFRALREIS